jgi:hypothetical protein
MDLSNNLTLLKHSPRWFTMYGAHSSDHLKQNDLGYNILKFQDSKFGLLLNHYIVSISRPLFQRSLHVIVRLKYRFDNTDLLSFLLLFFSFVGIGI